MKKRILTAFLLSACLLTGCIPAASAPPIATPLPTAVPTAVPAPTAAAPADHTALAPEDRYCLSLLSGNEKLLYDQLLDFFLGFGSVFQSPELDMDTLVRVCDAVLNDWPEIFWYTGAKTVTTETLGDRITGMTLTMEYQVQPQNIETAQLRLEEAVQECIGSISPSWTDYQKIKAVYDWLILRTDYDAASDDQNLYAVMLHRRGVCSGYAHAAQYLLNRLGLPCIYVSGTAYGQPHAWNLVRADGEWYHLDVTQGDPVYAGDAGLPADHISYSGFCLPSEWISRTHTPDDTLTLPECTAADCNYHVYNGLYLDHYDEDAVLNLLIRAARMGESISIRFSDQSLREQSYRRLYQEQHIFPLLSEVSRLTGAIDPASVSFSREGEDCLCIFLSYL